MRVCVTLLTLMVMKIHLAAAAAPPTAPANATRGVGVLLPSQGALAAGGLTTRGRHIIIKATGERFKLRCASWSGGQERHGIPAGMWAQHRSAIATQVC
jgi:hypothetical protein